MTRLSVELDERILGDLDRTAADAHQSRDETARAAIELGLQMLRKKKLQAQYEAAYAKHPVTAEEIARHPDDTPFRGENETW
jgi:metal-responsive CopG/Arc/MetJ family transcriptional regulator